MTRLFVAVVGTLASESFEFVYFLSVCLVQEWGGASELLRVTRLLDLVQPCVLFCFYSSSGTAGAGYLKCN